MKELFLLILKNLWLFFFYLFVLLLLMLVSVLVFEDVGLTGAFAEVGWAGLGISIVVTLNFWMCLVFCYPGEESEN